MVRTLKTIKNPYLLFSPFLVLFIIYVVYFITDGVSGDQARYLQFAGNMLHGYYSPPAPNIDLRNGPGYPIILVPFVALGLPFVCMTLLNALTHYLSIVLLFKALRQVVSFRLSLIVSLFWGCYYIGYQYMSTISYEPFSIFLVSLLIYCLTTAFVSTDARRAKKYIYFSGLVLGYLVLTKVIFGYVLFFFLVVGGIMWLLKKSVPNYRKGLLIIIIACVTTLPYLAYTYHLTGRFFYWGTGQENLYWMTTPNEDEYGDWKGELTRGTVSMGNYNVANAGDSLVAHHGKDFEEVGDTRGLERDDIFKKIAVRNIKEHPAKYAKNIFYNIGRILFHYPFSYAVQRTKVLFVFPLNGIVLTMILLCIIPTIRNWRKIIYPIRFLLFFTLLYLGACSLISSETRVFTLIVPVVLFWSAYIIHRSAKIDLKFFEDKN